MPPDNTTEHRSRRHAEIDSPREIVYSSSKLKYSPLEQAIRATPTAVREIYDSLVRAWDTGKMGGPPTPAAIAVLMAQWDLETAEGKHFYNYNFPGIKCAHPESQHHFYMATMEDYPEAKANAMVAGGHAYFREDKHAAGPGKLRVWLRKACFRAWLSLDDGARGYLGILLAAYANAIPFVRAGDPGGYAHAIGSEVRGKNAFYTGPEIIYKDGKPWGGYGPGMKVRHKKYVGIIKSWGF